MRSVGQVQQVVAIEWPAWQQAVGDERSPHVNGEVGHNFVDITTNNGQQARLFAQPRPRFVAAWEAADPVADDDDEVV